MLIVLYLLVVLAVLFAAAVVATREDPVLVDAPADSADLALPSGPMQAEDVAEVRFGLTVRGYRMAEVDTVLDRLSAELGQRDARIAELERALIDLVEPELEALETAAGAPETPQPGAEVAWTTSAVAPGSEAVHAPTPVFPLEGAGEPAAPGVAAVPGSGDDLFPEVFAPEAAREGIAEATEQGIQDQPERWPSDPGGPDALAGALEWSGPPDRSDEPEPEPEPEPERAPAAAEQVSEPASEPVAELVSELVSEPVSEPEEEAMTWSVPAVPEAPWGRPGEDPVGSGAPEPDAPEADAPDPEAPDAAR